VERKGVVQADHGHFVAFVLQRVEEFHCVLSALCSRNAVFELSVNWHRPCRSVVDEQFDAHTRQKKRRRKREEGGEPVWNTLSLRSMYSFKNTIS
jgi:hypothetical protein